MVILVSAAAFLMAAIAVPAGTADPCADQANCAHATAAQLFALADRLAGAGDLSAAANILSALTQDPHPELRAEARFRLAAVREKMGDLKGAAQALRELLAEQPAANPARLELARILGRMGEANAARAQIAIAEAWGLPADVEPNVRRFSRAIPTSRRRGGSVELTAGPDSNINRSTNAQYVDTVIAPFQLDADARRQSGIGVTFDGHGYMHNDVLGADLVSSAGFQADLFDKPRFDDIQLSIDSGPQFDGKVGRIRPAALYERRWFGGHPYSSGFGASLDWVRKLGPKTELEVNGAEIRQNIAPNSGQDAWRSSFALGLSHTLGQATGARLSLRFAALDARVRPESLRQLGGGLFLAHQARFATLFGEVDYTRTRGIEPLFLFGKTRRDERFDASAGAVLSHVSVGGF